MGLSLEDTFAISALQLSMLLPLADSSGVSIVHRTSSAGLNSKPCLFHRASSFRLHVLRRFWGDGQQGTKVTKMLMPQAPVERPTGVGLAWHNTG